MSALHPLTIINNDLRMTRLLIERPRRKIERPEPKEAPALNVARLAAANSLTCPPPVRRKKKGF